MTSGSKASNFLMHGELSAGGYCWRIQSQPLKLFKFDRIKRISSLFWDSGQHHLQGKEARHPGLEVRRRMTGRCALARIPRGHMNGSFLIKTRVALWRR